jgi:hypothetical protein
MRLVGNDSPGQVFLFETADKRVQAIEQHRFRGHAGEVS